MDTPRPTTQETLLLEVRETRRSFGLGRGLLSVLLLGLPFLGRQRIRITNERITIEQGFWTKVRDDIEIFRIRDVVVKQSLYHRLVGIGDVVVKSMEGRTTEEQHLLKGIAGPVEAAEVIRNAWNAVARPKAPATTLD
jgi:uncharacterized membrane protein YdbT with pleckstrin-like domain